MTDEEIVAELADEEAELADEEIAAMCAAATTALREFEQAALAMIRTTALVLPNLDAGAAAELRAVRDRLVEAHGRWNNNQLLDALPPRPGPVPLSRERGLLGGCLAGDNVWGNDGLEQR